MGLNLKLKGIISPNPFKLLYKTGTTVGNETVVNTVSTTLSSTGYTFYPNSSTTYQASSDGSYYNTNPIVVTNVAYNTQYWFKILDTVTGGYVIENIFTNEQEIYDNCINCCLFTGGLSSYIPPTPTPTETPTPTPTPVSCVFENGTAVYGAVVTPTPTATVTPTPTTTVTPTITETETQTPTLTPSIIWYFNHGSGTSCTGSNLYVRKNGGSIVVLSTVSSGSASGTLPFSIVAGDQLLIGVDTGNQIGTGCRNAYVQYDSQQFVSSPAPAVDTDPAELTVTVTQNDLNYGITICGTLAGGICPV